jgi:hypothetical protein
VSGLDPQRRGVRVRGTILHHPIMQSGDGGAAGTDAQARDYCVDEAREGGEQQRKPEPERVALVLQIGLPNGPWMLEE